MGVEPTICDVEVHSLATPSGVQTHGLIACDRRNPLSHYAPTGLKSPVAHIKQPAVRNSNGFKPVKVFQRTCQLRSVAKLSRRFGMKSSTSPVGQFTRVIHLTHSLTPRCQWAADFRSLLPTGNGIRCKAQRLENLRSQFRF